MVIVEAMDSPGKVFATHNDWQIEAVKEAYPAVSFAIWQGTAALEQPKPDHEHSRLRSVPDIPDGYACIRPLEDSA